MSKIIFPENWLLNIIDLNQLSSMLSLSVDYLLNWEKKIPFSYYRKIIINREKQRELLIPALELRNIQRRILDRILNFKFPSYIHGGISGRSIITNAKTHLNQKWIMCLDIRNFFPLVHFKRIYNNFILPFSGKVSALDYNQPK